MNDDFENRVLEWEKKIEDVIIGIMQEPDERGVAIVVNSAPIVSEFNNAIARLRTARKQHRYVVAPLSGSQ
jgi:hypothetical protein